MNGRLLAMLVVGVLTAFGAYGAAGSTSVGGLSADPTRPPAPAPGAPGGEPRPQARTVQSVLIAPGRSVAIVDGEMVRVGSRLGDAEVVKISEIGVVLRANGHTETLKLLPDAKRIAGRPPRQAADAANEERAK